MARGNRLRDGEREMPDREEAADRERETRASPSERVGRTSHSGQVSREGDAFLHTGNSRDSGPVTKELQPVSHSWKRRGSAQQRTTGSGDTFGSLHLLVSLASVSPASCERPGPVGGLHCRDSLESLSDMAASCLQQSLCFLCPGSPGPLALWPGPGLATGARTAPGGPWSPPPRFLPGPPPDFSQSWGTRPCPAWTTVPQCPPPPSPHPPPHTHTQLPHRAQASPKTRRIGKRVPLDGSIAPKMPTCPSSPQRSLRPLLRKKRQALSSMLQDGGSLTWHLGTALGHLQLLPGWPLQSQGPQRDGGPFAQASATRRQWRPLQAACPQAQGRASLAKPLATCLGQMMATWPAHCPRGDILTWALLCLLNTHVERRGRGGGGGVG